MKILYISSPSFVDCDLPLIKSLKEQYIDITYLILINPYLLRSTIINIKKIYPKTGIFHTSIYPEFKKLEKYISLDNVYICNRNATSKKSFYYWKEKIELWKFIKNGKFDLIHTDLLFCKEDRFIYRLGKFVTTIHDPIPHTGESWNYKKAQYNNAISKSLGLVLLNSKQKLPFCKKFNISEDKILINKLGVYETFNCFLDNCKTKDDVGKKNVLFFGRIAPYKGIEYLCQAMLKVHEVLPDVTLTIAGKGNFHFDITPFKNLNYIEFKNYYIGPEELTNLIFQTSVVVCPYTDATQSGVIMTSYALDKPVIATNVGGLMEMVIEGKTGLLVNPKNSEDLAQAIINVLSDDNKLKEFESNIKEEIFNFFSWKKIANNYIEFYKKIIFN